MNSEPSILPELWQQRTWLRRFARGLVGDREAVDDIVQETLVAAWQRPPDLDRDVRPWLAQVARNRVRDQARAESSRRAREVVASEAATSEGGAPTAEDVLVDGDLHRELAGVVAELEEPFRQTLFQRYYEGLTAAEIARQGNVPAGTVRWRLKEGLDRARRQLDQRHGGDRRTWMRAIVPLIPPGALPRSGPSPLLTAAKVFTVVAGAAIIAAGVRVVSIQRSLRTLPAPTAAADDGDDGALGGTPALAAAGSSPSPTSASLAMCQQRMQRTHDEINEIERDLFEWDEDFAFALGTPNPTAEATLRPFVEGALAREDGKVLEHRFACHTWACQLAMRKRSPGSYGPFSGGDILARAVTVKATSAVTALGLEERAGTFIHLDHIPLRQPSAEPLPGDRRYPDPRPAPPRPSTPESCTALQQAMDAEIAGLRSRWLSREPKQHLFERTPTRNRQLEDDLNALLPWWRRILVHSECRGQVCYRVPYLGRLSPVVWALDHNDRAAIRHRYDVHEQSGGVEGYLELKPRGGR